MRRELGDAERSGYKSSTKEEEVRGTGTGTGTGRENEVRAELIGRSFFSRPTP